MSDDPQRRAMQLELLVIALAAESESAQVIAAAACLALYGRAVPKLEADVRATLDAESDAKGRWCII